MQLWRSWRVHFDAPCDVVRTYIYKYDEVEIGMWVERRPKPLGTEEKERAKTVNGGKLRHFSFQDWRQILGASERKRRKWLESCDTRAAGAGAEQRAQSHRLCRTFCSPTSIPFALFLFVRRKNFSSSILQVLKTLLTLDLATSEAQDDGRGDKHNGTKN